MPPSIPPGYHAVTPYLIVNGASAALDFYTRAFGAAEMFRMPDKDGRVGHAEFKIGDSIVMLADEFPDMGIRGPHTIGGSPIAIMLYVDDVDAVYANALSAGATSQRPLENKFYGDRSGSVMDPFGHTWHLATHVEDVSPEELERRLKEMGTGK